MRISIVTAEVFVQKLLTSVSGLLKNRFVKNAGWIGLSELVNRVTRLITAIILARYLTPLEFGVAAVALTANDLIKILAQNGVGAKIVQASEDELESICQAAYQINWLFCGGLFALQMIVAFFVGYYYQNTEVAKMIGFLSLVYLMMPFALVEAFLIQRDNRLNVTAVIGATQTSVDNLLTVILAISGLGVWAIILPKVIVGPIWVIGTLSQQSWRRDSSVQKANFSNILNYGKNILGSEISKALRLHSDNLIVAFFLGLEAAGIYFFAKNAGLGISLSLISAFNQSLFAHLCDYKNRKKQFKNEFFRSLKIVSMLLIPIILLQGGLSHWYVPVVFGEQWESATIILMLMCFSAIPRPFGEAASELMKSVGEVKRDLHWNIVFTIMFVLAILIGQMAGLLGVVIAVLIVHLLCPLYCIWATRAVFSSRGVPNRLAYQQGD